MADVVTDLNLAGISHDSLVEIIQFLRPHLNMETGPWIAGGCLHRIVTDKLITTDFDVDVFCADGTQVIAVERAIRGKHFGLPIQVVKNHLFPTAKAVIDDFDFTVVQFVSDGSKLMCGENTMSDLDARRLRVNPLSEIRAPSRLSKYCALGYTPDVETIEKSTSCNVRQGSYYLSDEIEVSDDLDIDFEYTDFMKVKSALVDCWCMHIGGKPIVFVHGHPMPVRLAYPLSLLGQSSDRHAPFILKYLERWRKQGLPSFMGHIELQSTIAPLKDKILEAYSWIGSTT